ncbi:hypothetical protein LSH36_1137g00084 [Paralvinella palmiformis]|uniref:Uncharacterized protein n=1 Tax=Paralvinella palmiformis TaxID=53620 RepID=A0AAD9IVB6_9ANNE|nr:hypothetical protein LSH36_1137g00084 [Paralvinella palmiformis]
MKYILNPVILLLLYDIIQHAVGDQLINSFDDIIGPGNYTYYRLMHRGYIRLILDSLEGDADLYVSSQTLNPTFAEYDLQSTTCGDDVVDINPELHRPVTIGVYGYPLSARTRYILHILLVTDYDHGYPEQITSEKLNKPVVNPNKKSFVSSVKDEEESVIWTILVGILKVLLDILL